MTSLAMVLGARGNAASAWGVGLIFGMAEGGVEVRDAELSVGDLRGRARVAVQLANGVPLEDLAEPLLDLGDLTGQRCRVAGGAFEHLDGDRAAVGGAQEAVDDLQLAPLAVAIAA